MNTVLKPVDRRKVPITLRVNGEEVEVSFAPYKTLLEVLREDLDLTGTKHGCELGECGACTVLIDGEPLLSCLKLAIECDGCSIETVEGLAAGPELHPLQAAFADLGGSQCGYCTPGVLMTAKGLLDREPNPSRDRIKEALSGNLCRCTGYQQIVDSVQEAARVINETTVNETTANKTTVNETTVNETTVNETTVNETTVNEQRAGA